MENVESSKNSIELLKKDDNADLIIKRSKITNLKNQTIHETVEGDVLLEDLTESKIELSGEINSLRIRKSINCEISLIGICTTGSIYIENVKGGKLVIAGDQIRIHDTSNVDIFLFSKNSCILEDCEDLRFYPNRNAAKLFVAYNGDDNYWRCVQDFGFDSENSFKLIDLADES